MATNKGKSKNSNSGKQTQVIDNSAHVNRRGGGKPQPRQITSPVKVNAIKNAVLAQSKHFLALSGVEELGDIDAHLHFLCGLTTTSPLQDWLIATSDHQDDTASVFDIIYAVQVSAAQKAFYQACKAIRDSAFAYSDVDFGTFAVYGRNCGFFLVLVEKEIKQSKEDSARRAQGYLAKSAAAKRAPQASVSPIAQALIDSGHSEMTERQQVENRNRIQAVAKASGLTG